MKKLIIILLFVSVKYSYSQTTIGFYNTNSTWNIAYTYPQGSLQYPDFVSTVTNIFGFAGDTLIGTKLWNKMYLSGDSDFLKSSNPKKIGYIRVENKMVFYIDTLNKLDTLYNFNMHIGDSIRYSLPQMNKYFYITKIDSISIFNQYYKRYFFNKSNGGFGELTEIWIENIGSIHGPLFPASPRLFETEIPDSMNLTCSKVNDSVAWHNLDYNDCYIKIVLTVKEISELNIKIYPNPVINVLKIDIPEATDRKYLVSIYDLVGKSIINKVYNNNGQININMTDFQNGFYLLKLKSGEKNFMTKFIKQ